MCHYGNLAHFSRPVPQFRTDLPYGRNLAQLEEAVFRAMERNRRAGHSRNSAQLRRRDKAQPSEIHLENRSRNPAHFSPQNH